MSFRKRWEAIEEVTTTWYGKVMGPDLKAWEANGRLAVGAGEAGMSDEKREGASRWGAPSLVIDAQSTSCTAHDSLILQEPHSSNFVFIAQAW